MKLLIIGIALSCTFNCSAQVNRSENSSDTYPPPSYREPVNLNTKSLSPTYDSDTRAALMAFNNKKYDAALQLYIKAFKENNDLGLIQHRFKAACCYSFLGKYDNAFSELRRIAKSGKYFNLQELESEELLNPLHNDQRWNEIIDMVSANKQNLIDDLNSKKDK